MSAALFTITVSHCIGMKYIRFLIEAKMSFDDMHNLSLGQTKQWTHNTTCCWFIINELANL